MNRRKGSILEESLQKAQECWDAIDIEKVRNVSWLAIGFFGQRVQISLTAHASVTLNSLLHERHSDEELQRLKGLALVCGDMAAESGYFQGDTEIKFTSVDGYDLSAESLKRFETHEFEFFPHVEDVNDITLQANRFDLIVGCHGIHHVYNLGGLFYQAHKSLRNNGLFIVNEWIGPSYLQIPLRNHIVSTLLLLLLFPRPQRRRNHEGRIKGLWLQYSPKAFDPSEACNSNELLPQLLKYFDAVRMVKYGGLCYPMFEGLGHKIDEKNWLDNVRIRFVYHLEQLLTKLHVIKPLFITAVMEKRQQIYQQSSWRDKLVRSVKINLVDKCRL